MALVPHNNAVQYTSSSSCATTWHGHSNFIQSTALITQSTRPFDDPFTVQCRGRGSHCHECMDLEWKEYDKKAAAGSGDGIGHRQSLLTHDWSDASVSSCTTNYTRPGPSPLQPVPLTKPLALEIFPSVDLERTTSAFDPSRCLKRSPRAEHIPVDPCPNWLQPQTLRQQEACPSGHPPGSIPQRPVNIIVDTEAREPDRLSHQYADKVLHRSVQGTNKRQALRPQPQQPDPSIHPTPENPAGADDVFQQIPSPFTTEVSDSNFKRKCVPTSGRQSPFESSTNLQASLRPAFVKAASPTKNGLHTIEDMSGVSSQLQKSHRRSTSEVVMDVSVVLGENSRTYSSSGPLELSEVYAGLYHQDGTQVSQGSVPSPRPASALNRSQSEPVSVVHCAGREQFSETASSDSKVQHPRQNNTQGETRDQAATSATYSARLSRISEHLSEGGSLSHAENVHFTPSPHEGPTAISTDDSLASQARASTGKEKFTREYVGLSADMSDKKSTASQTTRIAHSTGHAHYLDRQMSTNAGTREDSTRDTGYAHPRIHVPKPRGGKHIRSANTYFRGESLALGLTRSHASIGMKTPAGSGL